MRIRGKHLARWWVVKSRSTTIGELSEVHLLRVHPHHRLLVNKQLHPLLLVNREQGLLLLAIQEHKQAEQGLAKARNASVAAEQVRAYAMALGMDVFYLCRVVYSVHALWLGVVRILFIANI